MPHTILNVEKSLKDLHWVSSAGDVPLDVIERDTDTISQHLNLDPLVSRLLRLREQDHLSATAFLHPR